MPDLRACLANPWPYVGWTLVVLVALAASYAYHPYVYAFTAIGLAWLSAAVGLAGLVAIVGSKIAVRRARVTIGISLAVTATALIAAFGVLRTFKWA